MRQFTTTEQTAKLIELGFEKPKNIVEGKLYSDIYFAYSIGELIEMLPMEDRTGERSMVYDGLEWVVNWDNDDGTINQVVATELLDALHSMLALLKKHGTL